MAHVIRLPITAIAVFGVGGLITVAVGVALGLGVGSATRNTEALLVGQVHTLIRSMEVSIEGALLPVTEQGYWIARQVETGQIDVTDTGALDVFMAGALAATPQVAGLAIVRPDGTSRRWARDNVVPVAEDWSARAPIREWLALGRERDRGSWQQPFWTPTLDLTVLLHDMPLRVEGRFVGMLGQVVPVAGLSRMLSQDHAQIGMVPFVLHGNSRVLAHPLLADFVGEPNEDATALPELADLGDAVLARIWTPDETPSLLRGLVETSAALVHYSDREYVILHKSISRFGPEPWTIGAYLDTELHGGREARRIVLAAASGVGVLLAAVALAMVVGLRLSRGIGRLADAARQVQGGDLDRLPELRHSHVREIDEAARAFASMVDGMRERAIIRSTLGRYVPAPVARTLLDAGGHLEPRETVATLLFCDIEGFTTLTESLGPRGIVAVLNGFFSEMVRILERHGGVVTQFQGDAILATFNVPVADPDHASNALAAALEMQQRTASGDFAGQRLAVRIGVNTGVVVAGAVGADDRLSYTVHGDAVNLAARLESLNKQHCTRILASENTTALVDGFDLRALGDVSVSGQTVPVRVYELTGLSGAERAAAN